ncbi:hypothetical protein FXO38_09877 [Capsicum annuum]|nr:hypothetical protein FXO38_09877 [Capsicum annuum]
MGSPQQPHQQPYVNTITSTFDMGDEIVQEHDGSNFIPLTADDKDRIYKPWQNSLIIKLIRRRMTHQLLKQKLTNIWKPTEETNLVDLGSEYFLLKFAKEQNMNHVLHDGPWFVQNGYFSVQRWEPKFVASKAKEAYTALWLRLLKLPSEFYDFEILRKVGDRVGLLLRVDTCTSMTSRERYAKLCVQVPMEQPLLHHVYIGSHIQEIHYEGFNMLGTLCGRVVHQTRFFHYKTSPQLHCTDDKPMGMNNVPTIESK